MLKRELLEVNKRKNINDTNLPLKKKKKKEIEKPSNPFEILNEFQMESEPIQEIQKEKIVKEKTDNMEQNIMKLYYDLQVPHEQRFIPKFHISIFKKYLQTLYIETKCHLYGSNQTHLRLNRNFDTDILITGKNSRTITDHLGNILYSNGEFQGIQIFGQEVKTIKCYHNSTKTSIDIMIDPNENSIAKISHENDIIKEFSLFDERCRILMFIIKFWAKSNNLANFGNNTSLINSFSYVVLVIYFLQRIDEPILPFYNRQKGMIEPDFVSNNDMTIVELLQGFFLFYSKFQFHDKVISIRNVNLLKKNVQYGKYPLVIEHPFINDKNSSASMNNNNFFLLKECIEKSYKLLEKGNFDKIFKL